MRLNRTRIILCAFALILVTFAFQTSAMAGATLTGKVAFEGTAPAPKPVNFGAEKQCALMHGDKPPMTEDLVVNSNNTVKWVLVHVKEGISGDYPAPSQAVVVNQKGCTFSPHVIGVIAGQKIEFTNNDPVLHNVRANAKVNKVFNIAQPIQGMKTPKSFDQPEIGIQMRCDVHFWMASYVHVLKHPFFAITGDDGAFTIKDLPAGNYTLEIWHESLGTQTQAVTVTEGESKEVNFTLKKS